MLTTGCCYCDEVILLLLGLSKPSYAEYHSTNYEILFTRNITETEKFVFSICHHFKHHSKPQSNPRGKLIQMLLIISGSVEINPGPKVKNPCGECKKSVKFYNSIACDECSQWYHMECIGMNDIIQNCYFDNSDLEWICRK